MAGLTFPRFWYPWAPVGIGVNALKETLMTTGRVFATVGGVALAASLALLASACGGAEQPQSSTPLASEQAAPPPAGQAAPPPAAEPAAQPAAAATAPAATAPAVAAAPLSAATAALVQDSAVDGVQVTLVEVRRTSGDTLTVRWRLTNTAKEDRQVSKGGSGWYDVYRLTGDSYLIDPINKKKYLVVKDSQNAPVTSKHGDWQGVTLTAGQSLNAWAKFPAPPVEVETIAVYLTDVPPFEDVPIVK